MHVKKNICIDDNCNYGDKIKTVGKDNSKNLGFLLSLILPLSYLYVHMGSERVLNNIINNTFLCISVVS
jgi:hypothetical protein